MARRPSAGDLDESAITRRIRRGVRAGDRRWCHVDSVDPHHRVDERHAELGAARRRCGVGPGAPVRLGYGQLRHLGLCVGRGRGDRGRWFDRRGRGGGAGSRRSPGYGVHRRGTRRRRAIRTGRRGRGRSGGCQRHPGAVDARRTDRGARHGHHDRRSGRGDEELCTRLGTVVARRLADRRRHIRHVERCHHGRPDRCAARRADHRRDRAVHDRADGRCSHRARYGRPVRLLPAGSAQYLRSRTRRRWLLRSWTTAVRASHRCRRTIRGRTVRPCRASPSSRRRARRTGRTARR